MKPVYWIEGIIGAGKSQLADQLGAALDMRVLKEPVESNPYLERFYKDQKRWAWPMQIHLMAERYGMQKLAVGEALSGRGAFLDRGLPGDRVFCKMHTEIGNISQIEWETYTRLYDIMASDLRPPSVIIFLDVEPSTAYARCQSRARKAEKVGAGGVTLEYLQDLSRGYYDLLSEIESGRHAWSRGMDVLRWPWNTDHQSIEPLVNILRSRIG